MVRFAHHDKVFMQGRTLEVCELELLWDLELRFGISVLRVYFRSFVMKYCSLIHFAFAFAVLALAGCSKQSGGSGAGTTGDYVTGTPLPERHEGTSFFGGNVNRNQFQPIYFDFDSQTVRGSENGKIQQIAQFMNGNSSEIIIAGFTDERGTAEYNRGLGERRAGAVRESLIAQGVDGNRIQTVSFGLEMPADSGHDESAWAKNRRAEIGVTR
jgi:peptidoglycan-associated lipoprotein